MSTIERRSRTQGSRRLPRANTALTAALIMLTACSPDAVVTPAPRSSAIAEGTASIAPNTTVSALTNHLAFWRTVDPTITFDAGANFFTPSLSEVPVETTRIDVGHYGSDVAAMSHFFHPGNKEIVMTTTWGATTAQCTSDAWFSFATTDYLSVRTDCNDMLTGQRTDAAFSTLIVGARSLPPRSAYAIATQPTVASYTPDTAGSYTSGTGAIRIDRIGVGDWYVTLGTGSPQGSTYLVSSFEERVVCTIAEWKNFGARVRCFERTGALVDARFKILQVATGRESFPFAFAWADQRSLATPYTPNPTFSHGTVVATRLSVGDYEIEFAGMASPPRRPENLQVSAFSTTYSACTIVDRNNSPIGRLVRVQCRDAAGRLADSRFNILLLR